MSQSIEDNARHLCRKRGENPDELVWTKSVMGRMIPVERSPASAPAGGVDFSTSGQHVQTERWRLYAQQAAEMLA